MSMQFVRAAMVALFAVGLSAACAKPETTKPVLEIPASWPNVSITEQSLAERPWGQIFRAPDVDALIREALVNNTDLRIAADRVELARAQFGITRSALFPALDGSGAYTRQRLPGLNPNENSVSESASLVLSVPTWEIDLWGRVRSATEAARRDLLASEEARKSLYTSIVSQVANGYLRLLELDAQLDLSRDTLGTRRESQRLIDARLRGGVASRLELNDAISLVAGAEQTIASLERVRSQTENALAILVGRNPGSIVRTVRLAQYALPPELPAGLPSALLTRRFDIRAAEESLRASDANVDAARLAFFPAVTLTGLVGLASPALRDLFDSGRYAWSISPAVTLPIFNAGRLQSNLEATQAQQRIAVEQYRFAVRNAFGEVSNALVDYERLGEERAALATSVAANRERLRLSELRYRAGVAAYFEVLDSSRQLFDAELALLNSTASQYRAVIELYRALGGGYDPEVDLPPPGVPANPLAPPGVRASGPQ
jgi:outer membrane protein, multidrug efflux system